MSASARPHRRFNPLTGQWVLVSPQRTQRPWQGRNETAAGGKRPAYDPGCYLCPGNQRAGGVANPRYGGTFVFDNDFAALESGGEKGGGPDPLHAPREGLGPAKPSLPHAIKDTDGAVDAGDGGPLFRAEGVRGACRVVCFSPRHDLTLAEMSPADVTAVIDTYAAETAALGARYRWVQAFENKGELMGCSNPHPHGQIWASDALPNEAAAEDQHQRAYAAAHGTRLLADYARLEHARGERVVHQSASWVAVVPYWAVWPFETLILPLMPVARLPDVTPAARGELGGLLVALLSAYDRLFDVSFPYSMGWHGAPFGTDDADAWQLHAHVYPPLLRSATVKKFMVGYELLAEPQRDLTPEAAAERLRALIRP